MTITGVSSSSSSSFTPSANNDRDTFRQLADAVQSGDLSTAQEAFTALTQSNPNLLTTSSPLGQDLNALGQALQSGDVTAAQQALQNLQTDAQKLGRGHGHHHHGHHGGGAKGVDASSTTPTDPNSPSATTTSPSATTSTTPTSTSSTNGSTFTFTV